MDDHLTWVWSGTSGRDLHDALLEACAILSPVTSYLEIGVDGGGSLNTVLCCGVPKRIVLCDIWDPTYCTHGNTKVHVQKLLKHFHATAEFCDGDSKNTVPKIQGTFDLVLVDADHSADAARRDLVNAWPLVRKDGILVMDDICHPNYPWLGKVWQKTIESWNCWPIVELRGDCNTAMVQKR